MFDLQSLPLEWSSRLQNDDIDNPIWAMTVDSEGNVYVAGRVDGALEDQTYEGNYDAWIAKYDSNGELVWLDQFGTPEDDRAWAITVDDSYLYVTGRTGGDLASSSLGEVDSFAAKYDLDGNLIWIQQFGSSGFEGPNGVGFDDAGNVYSIGHSNGFSQSGDYDVHTTKLDSEGNIVWETTFGTPEQDYVFRGDVDAAGNVYATGRTAGNLGADSQGSSDAFVSKQAPDTGEVIWVQQLGTSSEDSSYAVEVDASGNVYMAGFTYGDLEGESAGGSDAFIAKYDADGTLLWVDQFGTPLNDFGFGLAIGDSEIYFSGYTQWVSEDEENQIVVSWVAGYDESGNLQWQNSIETDYNDFNRDIAVDPEGNLYLTGYTEGLKGEKPEGEQEGPVSIDNDKDSWVVKIDSSDLPSSEADIQTQTGTPGDDYLFGDESEDLIIGGDGDDFILTFLGQDTIYGGEGDDTLVGSGDDDIIYDSSGMNFIGSGGGNDTVFAGEDNDIVDDFYGDDTHYLGAGDDLLIDNLGNDIIYGGEGDDFIESGSGNDLVTPGPGSDTLYYFSIAPAFIDSIDDFNADEDQFLLASSGFGDLSAGQLPEEQFVIGEVAQDGDDYFIYDNNSGTLYFDSDGNGPSEAIAFAQFNNTPDLTSANIIIDDSPALGSPEDDVIDGNSSDEYLNGKGGNDIIHGFGGDDFIEGHEGDDFIDAGDGDDIIAAAVGDDIVFGGDGDDYLAGSLGDDYLHGGNGVDVLVGGGDADIYALDTSSQEADYVFGFEELDSVELQVSNSQGLLSGQLSDENFVLATSAQDENDFVIYDVETGELFFDPDGSLAEEQILIAYFVGAPDLEASDFIITVDDTSEDPNTLVPVIGTAGDDFLEVPGGEAELYLGLGGDDRIETGSGDDVALGGAGSDNIVGARGFDEIYGQAGDDFLFGGSDDDFLDGGEGNDLVNGGLNNDVLNGGTGNDTLDGEEGNDTLDGEDGNDYLYGDAGDDTIYGGDGIDTINGGTENDMLYGGSGDDYMDGSQGDDVLNGDEGNDLMFGDEGNDIVSGGDGDDIVWGNLGNDTLYGNDGNDVVEGAWGEDVLYGGRGDDLLDGATSADILEGGQGNDVLEGAEGNDIINGAGLTYLGLTAEIDDLSGGADQDIFVLGDEDDIFYIAAGNDDYAILRDFNAGEDTIQLFGAPDDYVLANSPIPGVDGAGLFYDENENGLQDAGDELIAIIEGSTTLGFSESSDNSQFIAGTQSSTILDLSDQTQFTYAGVASTVITDMF